MAIFRGDIQIIFTFLIFCAFPPPKFSYGAHGLFIKSESYESLIKEPQLCEDGNQSDIYH